MNACTGLSCFQSCRCMYTASKIHAMPNLKLMPEHPNYVHKNQWVARMKQKSSKQHPVRKTKLHIPFKPTQPAPGGLKTPPLIH